MAENKETEKYNCIVILGAPGSGKGTLGRTIGSIPRFFHTSCGDVFRALDTRTELGQKFVEYSSRGKLVPDDITIKLWRINIRDRVMTHQIKPDIDTLVLDGIPRNTHQADLLVPFCDVKLLIHLTIPNRAELARRIRKRALKDNRFDDADENVIQKRIKIYEEESKPILDYYPPEKIITIDAERSPLAVVAETLTILNQKNFG